MIKRLKDEKIVITGRFQAFKRETAILLIQSLGGVYQAAVGKETSLLVRGYVTIDLFDQQKQSLKLQKAKELETVSIINENAFLIRCLLELENLTSDEQKRYIEKWGEDIRIQFQELSLKKNNGLIIELISLLKKKLTVV